jgi:hypothetical protein
LSGGAKHKEYDPPSLPRIGEFNLHFWICLLALRGTSSWWGLNRSLIIHLRHGARHLESEKTVDVRTKNKTLIEEEVKKYQQELEKCTIQMEKFQTMLKIVMTKIEKLSTPVEESSNRRLD